MRTEPRSGLAAALFGKTRIRLLGLFLTHSDEAYYMREVARATGAGLGAVQRELTRLSQAGILQRTVRGHQVFYRANKTCPIFSEMRALIVKTVGIADVLRDALAGFPNRIHVAFLYGSMARGTETAASDVDLLVIGDISFAEVVAALAPVQERLGREVNPSVYPSREFQRKLGQGHHFLTALLHEPKVFVLGDEHELERLAQGKLAHRAPNQQARNRRSAGGRRS